MAAGIRFGPHAIQHALQLRTMPAVRLRAKFLRHLRNILTKFVHECPFDSQLSLDYARRQLICAKEWSQLGDSYLWGTGRGRSNHKYHRVSSASLSGCIGRMATTGSHARASNRQALIKSIRSAPSDGQGSG
jgi:hypothetical protein